MSECFHENEVWRCIACRQCATCCSCNEDCVTRITELEEALRPFAEERDAFDRVACVIRAQAALRPKAGYVTVPSDIDRHHATATGFSAAQAEEKYPPPDIETAEQITRERIGEWDYAADPHGYCHDRPTLIALLAELEALQAGETP